MVDTDKSYARDEAFWQKYIKGRPPIPESFFERVREYHAEHGGKFGVVHDVGAGVGVQSPRLAKYFEHVIVSDVVPENVDIAKDRLGTGQYSYRAAKIEDADDLAEASVDMVFASFVMHFAHFEEAFEAIAKQLKPSGTFVALVCAPSELESQEASVVWRRIWDEGIRVVLRHARDRADRLRTIGNASVGYDTMPLNEEYFERGALRISLNVRGSWPSMLPDDLQEELDLDSSRPRNAVGVNDQLIQQKDSDWTFQADLQSLRNQFDSLPGAALEPTAFDAMWVELGAILSSGKTVRGVWPAKIILATRK